MLTLPAFGTHDEAVKIRLKTGQNFHNALVSLCSAETITSVTFSDTYTYNGSTGFDNENVLRGSVRNCAVTIANRRNHEVQANYDCFKLFNGLTNAAQIDTGAINWDYAVNCRLMFNTCKAWNGHAPSLKSAVDLYTSFSRCESLQSVAYAPQAKALGWAYSNCKSLVSANIASGENLQSAFAGCSNLTEAVIPPNAVTLTQTFDNCPNLTGTFQIPECASNVFRTFGYCNRDLDIYIANGSLNLYGMLTYKASGRVNIHVPGRDCLAFASAKNALLEGLQWTEATGHVYNSAREVYVYY